MAFAHCILFSSVESSSINYVSSGDFVPSYGESTIIISMLAINSNKCLLILLNTPTILCEVDQKKKEFGHTLLMASTVKD